MCKQISQRLFYANSLLKYFTGTATMSSIVAESIDEDSNSSAKPSSESSFKLLTSLLQVSLQPNEKLSPNWSKMMADLEHLTYDSIDDVQLEQIIKFANSETYAKATKFLEDGSGVFSKCRLPNDQDDSQDGFGVHPVHYPSSLPKQKKLNRVKPKAVLDSSMAHLYLMTEEEELAALDLLMHSMDTWVNYDFSALGGQSMDELVAKLKAMHKFGIKGSRVYRLAYKLRSKSSRRWARLKLRLRIYQQYFVNRMFNSANCIITCWLFCFCASLFH